MSVLAKRLFIGSLPWATDNKKLEEIFSQFGKVTSAMVAMDRQTGRSRGFGFVEFEDDAAATEAISKMDGADLEGRKIVVNEARPREDR